jgi:hypothetical protein
MDPRYKTAGMTEISGRPYFSLPLLNDSLCLLQNGATQPFEEAFGCAPVRARLRPAQPLVGVGHKPMEAFTADPIQIGPGH